MIRRTHHDKSIARHGSERQRGVINGTLRKTKVGRTVKNGGRDVGGIAFAQDDANRRMRGPETHEKRRKPIAGDRLARLNCKRSALKTTQFGQCQLRKPRASLRRLGLDEKQPPRLAQFDAASNPIEEVNPIAGFQSVDRRAHRRRGEVQRLGGFA